MPSFEVDADLYDEPCITNIPAKHRLACMGLWTLAGMWAARKGSGGAVTRGLVEMLAGGSLKEAELLVSTGLWAETDDGYRFADMAVTRTANHEPSVTPGALRQKRYRDRLRAARSVTSEPGPGLGRDVGGLGGALNSDSDLSSDPLPLSSEITELSGGNAGAREVGPEPGRLRFELEELVRAEFSERNVTSQKASAGQWLDGCKTVQEALDLRLYPDARTALTAFATKLVAAVAAKKPPALGLALQQVQLGEQRAELAGGRQLSQQALDALRRRNAPPEMG